MANTAPAWGRGHGEVTPTTAGSVGIEASTEEIPQKEYFLRLPRSIDGTLDQALVLIATRPRFAPPPAPPIRADHPPAAPRQVPARFTFAVAGKALPPWELTERLTAYVINLETVRANPRYSSGYLALTAGLTTQAEGVQVSLLGMPDPLLLGESLDGPLESFAAEAEEADVKALFEALVLETAGRREEARAAYRKLVDAENEQVGRLARRSLRMLSYLTRPYKLSGNFLEHYHWGLYLQHCGFYGPAFTEFDECRVLDASSVESQFRCGELADRLDHPAYRSGQFLSRCGAPTPSGINDWHALVVIQRSRSYEEAEDGKPVARRKTLDATEILDIKFGWLFVEQSIWGASRGRIRIVTSFYELRDENERPFVDHGGVPGPPDDLIEQRGWFDGVVAVVPRVPGDSGAHLRTVGGDQGPNGAALSTLYHDLPWQYLLAAWCEQFDWAMRVGEILPAYPLGEMARHAGDAPTPNDGYGGRAALFYHLPTRESILADVAPLPTAETEYMDLWTVEGPFPVQASTGEAQWSRHVLDPLPDPRRGAGVPHRTVVMASERPFVDLAGVFPKAGRALARATGWVYSPVDQRVRMWLGQNDGAAVWINGQLAHRGDYYSANKFADKDLLDTVASMADLREGWNEIRVVVESWPAPRDAGWGFSLRLCGTDHTPLAGLAYTNRKPPETATAMRPKVGPYYRWADVHDDFLRKLPALGEAELRMVTGLTELTVSAFVDGPGGCFAVGVRERKQEGGYRLPPRGWTTATDRDTRLNNVLDLSREAFAALRYTKEGTQRDLLFIRPEALEAFLYCGRASPEAGKVFGGSVAANRILGYVPIPAEGSAGILMVIETLLGDTNGWPIDEEDLLDPIYVRPPPLPLASQSSVPTTAPASP